MDEILNNLRVGEILYTTRNRVNYLFIARNENGDILYSINNNRKTLPMLTINSALVARSNSQEINISWYRNFNEREYNSRPCNLKVLQELLSRLE